MAGRLAGLPLDAGEQPGPWQARAHIGGLAGQHGTERLNGEIKRHGEVVGIFPNEAAVTRPIGAPLLKQNDEWAVQRALGHDRWDGPA